ncbi:MAG: Rieske [2Fe-2S] iron-sulfur protein [Gemmatimonadetes bacterium]|nr:Rieske [2Fe-2S] iron-sulfur protein [Gemmatimonadota bacterium]
MSCEDCVSRREFLGKTTLAVAGAAALAAGCGDGQFGPTTLVASTDTALSVKVASVPALATVGQLVRVGPASAYVAVKRTGAASFAAIRVICTHEGCETNIQASNIFVCPCHNSRYDSDGKVTKQPDGGGSATNLPTIAAKYDAATDTLTIG